MSNDEDWIENVLEPNPGPLSPNHEQPPLEEPISSPWTETLRSGTVALVWTSGLNMGCVFFNEPWLKFRGRSLEEESGNGWAEGVHPDDLNRCLTIYVSSFQKKEDFIMDYRLKRRDGQYRWIRDKGRPTYSSDGIFTGYLGACVEIAKDGSVLSGAFSFKLPPDALRSSSSIFSTLQQQYQQKQFYHLYEQLKRFPQQQQQQQWILLQQHQQQQQLLANHNNVSTSPTQNSNDNSYEYQVLKRKLLLEQFEI